MPILLGILKIVGILLLSLLALLVIALAMPIGLRLDWTPGRLRLFARVGPVELCLSPRPAKSAGKAAAPVPPIGPPPGQTDGGAPPAPPPSPPPKTSKAAARPAEAAPPPGRRGLLPGFLQRRVDAVLALARRDPLALARCLLGHLGWLGRRLLRRIRVTGLTVFWTVHCEEASATAVRYGQLMALLNNLLTLLRQWMTIRADSLRLEPDFTGSLADQRRIAFCLRTRPGILLAVLLRLAWRVWHDPLLQPQPQKDA